MVSSQQQKTADICPNSAQTTNEQEQHTEDVNSAKAKSTRWGKNV